MNIPSIHPIRLVAVLLLVTVVAYSSYHYLKPQTFAYIKVREGTTIQGGTALQFDHVEKGVIFLGDFWPKKENPVPGLVPWSQITRLLGQPVGRQVQAGSPLLLTDIGHNGQLNDSLGKHKTSISLPIEKEGIVPPLSVGDKVHVYASFEDDDGAHTGLLLQYMPITDVLREKEGKKYTQVAVMLTVSTDEAVMLTHALNYGKIRLGKASLQDGVEPGVGDLAFAKALMKTKKRWSEGEEKL